MRMAKQGSSGQLAIILLASLALAVCVSCAPKESKPSPAAGQVGDSFDISGFDSYNVDNNNILPYDPLVMKPTRVEVAVSRGQNNKIKSSSYTDLERESSSSSSAGPTATQAKQPNVANVMAAGDDAERSGSPNVDKIKDIAMNSREVRLVGPNQKEVEMKDDLPTKVVVALENLQKEAKEVYEQVNDKLDKGWTELKRSEVWGQVNEKLDKGWTDFKSMVEGVVSPSSKSG